MTTPRTVTAVQRIRISILNGGVKKMVVKAGLPEHYSVHSLRHTYVTYLRRKGVGYDIIQRLVAHTSPRMTRGAYDHTEALSFRQYAEMVRFEEENPEGQK